MTHVHFCDVGGHFWECGGEAGRLEAGDTEPSICICADCKVPMVNGDHGVCSSELLACPEHLHTHRSPEAEAAMAELLSVPNDSAQVQRAVEVLQQNKKLKAVCVWCLHEFDEYSPKLDADHFAHDCPTAPDKLRDDALQSLARRNENATKQ